MHDKSAVNKAMPGRALLPDFATILVNGVPSHRWLPAPGAATLTLEKSLLLRGSGTELYAPYRGLRGLQECKPGQLMVPDQ
jgi:hypothetical protein